MIKRITSKCGKRHRPEIDMMEYIQNSDECMKNTGMYQPENSDDLIIEAGLFDEISSGC